MFIDSAFPADLEQLLALFHANGEGLPKETIHKSLARLYGLLDLMSFPTGTLIAKYQVPASTNCCCRSNARYLPTHAHGLCRLCQQRLGR